ncbi:amidohydrolase [Anaeromicrobium sediminis]|uniref:Amidohydrolase 3 domain-containing protein n=1 Tax=Anaeromicrobium sediminis TaxID=1478221 RepID=A0A267MGF0_9FIRM|nr:amidohydrolase [Anaeromicrobium sediminis]PAB57945.1 hypothetical protein CCE28_17425 [Anaeromicrobium sediminis]
MNTILYNGNIITMDSKSPKSEALFIRDNKFFKVGKNEEIFSLKDENTRLIDLENKTVVPGFNDSHMHLVNFANSLHMIPLTNCKSIDDLIGMGKDYLSTNPNHKDWIIGRGWNQDNFHEKEFPTRYDLDKISTEFPVCYVRACGHVLVVNSKALEMADIDSSSSQVDGGYFDVDTHNNPLGIFRENALNLIYKKIPTPTVDEIKKIILDACKLALADGITSIQTDDFEAFPDKDFHKIIKAYKELNNEGKLPIRIYEQCLLQNTERLNSFLSKGYSTGYGDDFFKIGPLKLLADGSLGARTAYLSQPYADDSTTCGIGVFTQDELDELVLTAHKNNMQVAIHCIGDKIMDMSFKSIKNALDKAPKSDHRHGIVHAQITTNKLIDEFKENNVLAYIQPIFLDYDIHIVEDRVGKDRAKETYNFKTLMDNGVHTAYGSDCPVEPFNVFRGIYSAVTRQDLSGYPKNGWLPNEKVSVEDALYNFTHEGAYASFEENVKGLIKENYLADFVVLDRDILNITPEEIKDTKVLMTFVDGELKYKK